MSLSLELTNELRTSGRFNQNFNKLKNYFNLKSDDRNITSIVRRIKSNEGLKSLYWNKTKELNLKHFVEIQKTQKENEYTKILRSNSKFRFYQQLWIGNSCPDIIFPQLCLRDTSSGKIISHGFAIEIDGPIHEYSQVKMNKDNHKEDYLQSLNMLVLRITNSDIRKGYLPLPIKDPNIQTLDSRSRAMVWKRIMTATILAHFEFEEILKLFKQPTNLKRRK